ncbi:MAG: hypothetical protein FJ037_05060 [Chloroflexi bacterium]|nr:hypothetical protein [Chloroflexota bacterium]
MAKRPGIRCDQAIRPLGVANCCVTDLEPCFKPASHQHTQTSIALCAQHWENAMTMGGAEAGQWPVGMRILPFPAGWVALPPQEEESEAAATPVTLWVEPKQTVGGLIIDL